MMGRLKHDQGQFFYSFRLDEAVPDDHPVRELAAVLESELGAFRVGASLSAARPAPVLMLRMLVVGDVFAIRSERALCREGSLGIFAGPQ
jgi:transposase